MNSTASIEPVAANRVPDNDETVLQIDLRVNRIPSDEIYEDKQSLQSITNQIEKLVDTEKSRQEELLKNDILSEEASMKFYEAGNCEPHEGSSTKNRQSAMSALPSIRGSWIPSMPMRRKA